MAEALSGGFRQSEREKVVERIKSGELRYMVATDIAARGIDIAHLSHVVNYALPEFSEVYLHRVGRTGRAGRSGTAISLVDGKGLGTYTVLEREFDVKFKKLELPEGRRSLPLGAKNSERTFGKSRDCGSRSAPKHCRRYSKARFFPERCRISTQVILLAAS